MLHLEEDRGNIFFFQQDGAPFHVHGRMTQFLKNRLPGRWIGRGGPTVWSHRSPNLTPINLFLGRYVKIILPPQKPQNLDENSHSICL
jgi:hypothetical protein